MYVIEDEGKVASAVVINDEFDEAYNKVRWQYKYNNVGIVHRLCVNPNIQGKGIGKLTLLKAEEQLKKSNYDVVRLDTFHQNEGAMNLYKNQGYIFAGEVEFRMGKFYCYEKQLK